MSKRYKPTIPEYFKYMPDNSYLSSKDIIEIFGFKGRQGVENLIVRGYLPEPVIRNKRSMKLMCKPSRQWSKKQIVEAIKKYLEEYFPNEG